jgi:uncharacterized membrane protein YeaQ/YmgE (transglycosylase-associated protein family)
MSYVVILIITLLLGFWASTIAKKRGRSEGWAFVWGFLFGLIGVACVALFMKDQRPPVRESGHARRS